MTHKLAAAGWRLRLICAVVLAPTAALALMSACLAAFPAEMGQRLIWSGLLFPALWPVLIFYIYWSETAYRPCFALLLASLASAALILFP